MILSAHAKINLGLTITGRRADGFHDLQTVMVPVGLCDILEILPVEGQNEGLRFSVSGISVDEGPEGNLCERAYTSLAAAGKLPAVSAHLHKQIPVGAGLGGGSSDAAMMLRGLNSLMDEPLKPDELKLVASELGSDCPFFLQDGPMMAEGRGDVLSPVNLPLEDLHIVILFTGLHISTAGAYSQVILQPGKEDLRRQIGQPVDRWEGVLENDFEKSVFLRHPGLAQIKEDLYRSGAVFASMSGSGSAMYGLYRKPPVLPDTLKSWKVWGGHAGAPAPFI